MPHRYIELRNTDVYSQIGKKLNMVMKGPNISIDNW